MIKLKQIGSNMTTLTLDGYELFFSYQTLVGYHNGKAYITDKFFSKTTSSHITKWLATYGLDKKRAYIIKQEKLDAISANLDTASKPVR